MYESKLLDQPQLMPIKKEEPISKKKTARKTDSELKEMITDDHGKSIPF
jgi:hypothetical protein